MLKQVTLVEYAAALCRSFVVETIGVLKKNPDRSRLLLSPQIQLKICIMILGDMGQFSWYNTLYPGDMSLQNSTTRISSFPIQHILTPYRAYYQFLKKIISHDAVFFSTSWFFFEFDLFTFRPFSWFSLPPFKGLTIRIMCMSNLTCQKLTGV